MAKRTSPLLVSRMAQNTVVNMQLSLSAARILFTEESIWSGSPSRCPSDFNRVFATIMYSAAGTPLSETSAIRKQRLLSSIKKKS